MGAASSSRSAAWRAPRPRWCRPWIEPSDLPRRCGDLARGQSGDVAQDRAPRAAPREDARSASRRHCARSKPDLLVTLVARADLLDRDLPAGAHVVERHVARDREDPGGERHLALLVALDRGHQLGEDVLGHVLGLVAVANDAAHVRAHVVGEAHVEEVKRAHVALLGARHRAANEIRLVGASRPGQNVQAQHPMRRPHRVFRSTPRVPHGSLTDSPPAHPCAHE